MTTSLVRWLFGAAPVIAIGLLVAACSGAAPSQTSTTTPSANAPAIATSISSASTPTAVSAGNLADPWEYCARVGTIDAPDARYTGERVPAAVAEGLKRASGGAPSAPLEAFTRGTSWRCMDAKVYACTVGANLPCGEKAIVSRDPSAAVKEFCTGNAGASVIPAAVTGRATVFAWRCDGSQPVIDRQLFEADKQGFIATFWYELPRP